MKIQGSATLTAISDGWVDNDITRYICQSADGHRIPKFYFYPSTMSKTTLWLRCEKKEFERRAALTPTTAKRLIDAGFEIIVERDQQRIFNDSEYEA